MLWLGGPGFESYTLHKGLTLIEHALKRVHSRLELVHTSIQIDNVEPHSQVNPLIYDIRYTYNHIEHFNLIIHAYATLNNVRRVATFGLTLEDQGGVLLEEALNKFVHARGVSNQLRLVYLVKDCYK